MEGRPCPSFHLMSPACTAPSSHNRLLWKHASIVLESSSTPSRTALPLPAAFRLTYFRKSLRWSERSIHRRHARLFDLYLTFLASHAPNHSPFTVCENMSFSPLSSVPATLGGDSTGRHGEDMCKLHTTTEWGLSLWQHAIYA